MIFFQLISLYFFCASFLFFSHAPCENFFRPRADSTINVTDSSLFCHARLGEGKETSSFPALLAKKISRIDRRFAAFARLKNKKSAGKGTTRQRQQQRQNNTKKISRIAALTLHYTAKPKERPRGYDTTKTKTRQKQQQQLNYFL
jgi:hypothetical protein